MMHANNIVINILLLSDTETSGFILVFVPVSRCKTRRQAAILLADVGPVGCNAA
jgi:hypothetical protein